MNKNINPNVFKGIFDELKKVEWPRRQEALHLSLVVVIISLLIGSYIGVLDYIFAQGLKLLLNSKV